MLARAAAPKLTMATTGRLSVPVFESSARILPAQEIGFTQDREGERASALGWKMQSSPSLP
eukprot:231997-Pyramimonas_sp.AAC.1